MYADNNYDGITITDGATVRWDHASRSHQLTIRLWSSGKRAVDGVPAPVVVLRDDSMLANNLCPAR